MVQFPSIDWLRDEVEWEDAPEGGQEGNFEYDGIYYKVKVEIDAYYDAFDMEWYGELKDDTSAEVLGDRLSGNLFGPWKDFEERYPDYSYSAADARYEALLAEEQSEDGEHYVTDVYLDEDAATGEWVVTYESRLMLSEEGPAKYGGTRERYWTPPEDLETEILAAMESEDEEAGRKAIKLMVDLWKRREGLGDDWYMVTIQVEACEDEDCDGVLGEAVVGGVEYDMGMNEPNENLYATMAEVIAEAGMEAVDQMEAAEEPPLSAGPIEIPRSLLGDLFQFQYIGDATEDLATIKRLALNDQAVDAELVQEVGRALIELAQDQAKHAASMGMPTSAAQRSVKYIASVGQQLLSLQPITATATTAVAPPTGGTYTTSYTVMHNGRTVTVEEVYGGNSHGTPAEFATREEAEEFAKKFAQTAHIDISEVEILEDYNL